MDGNFPTHSDIESAVTPRSEVFVTHLLRADVLRPVRRVLHPTVDRLKCTCGVSLTKLVPASDTVSKGSKSEEYGVYGVVPRPATKQAAKLGTLVGQGDRSTYRESRGVSVCLSAQAQSVVVALRSDF